MKRRTKGRKIILVVGCFFLGVVLAALVYVYTIVMESAAYGFMRGAKQDGFDAPIMAGHPEVMRFYTLDKDMGEVLRAARLELSPERGWKQLEPKNDKFWWFVGSRSTLILSPMPGRIDVTSVWVWHDATFPEEILGTTYQWIPDRFAELR